MLKLSVLTKPSLGSKPIYLIWDGTMLVHVTCDCLFKGLDHPGFIFCTAITLPLLMSEDVLGETDYNGNFASGARHGNVFGTQFHPEKSHQWGISLLKNFAEL
jgi:imidazoleglycerol phosphate synthase glutamine amidotransferase subunit HisH